MMPQFRTVLLAALCGAGAFLASAPAQEAGRDDAARQVLELLERSRDRLRGDEVDAEARQRVARDLQLVMDIVREHVERTRDEDRRRDAERREFEQQLRQREEAMRRAEDGLRERMERMREEMAGQREAERRELEERLRSREAELRQRLEAQRAEVEQHRAELEHRLQEARRMAQAEEQRSGAEQRDVRRALDEARAQVERAQAEAEAMRRAAEEARRQVERARREAEGQPREVRARDGGDGDSALERIARMARERAGAAERTGTAPEPQRRAAAGWLELDRAVPLGQTDAEPARVRARALPTAPTDRPAVARVRAMVPGTAPGPNPPAVAVRPPAPAAPTAPAAPAPAAPPATVIQGNQQVYIYGGTPQGADLGAELKKLRQELQETRAMVEKLRQLVEQRRVGRAAAPGADDFAESVARAAFIEPAPPVPAQVTFSTPLGAHAAPIAIELTVPTIELPAVVVPATPAQPGRID